MWLWLSTVAGVNEVPRVFHLAAEHFRKRAILMFIIPSHFRVCRSVRSNNQRTAPRRRTFQALWLLASLLMLTNVGDAQDKKKSPQVAPPNHALLSSTIDGWYFVPKEFKENYDTTLARLEALQSDVASGKIRASKAQAELAELQNKLAALSQEIEAKKVHVVGTTLYEQTETIEFELGKEHPSHATLLPLVQKELLVGA